MPRSVIPIIPDKFDYGLCPPENRYALDQVPLEFSDYKQSHNDVGAGECFIRGSKVDLSKRQASLQLTVRAVHPQNVKPGIVFRAVPKMTLTDDGEVTVDPHQASRLKELDKYAEGVSVYYQEKAWVDPTVARAHLEDFNRQTKVEVENNFDPPPFPVN